jgi:hypothetical protein
MPRLNSMLAAVARHSPHQRSGSLAQLPRRFAVVALATVFAAMAGTARADFIQFDDSQTSSITVDANGFLNTHLLLDNSIVATNNNYINVSTTLQKGFDITFTGVSTGIIPPSTFIETIVYVAAASSVKPIAELVLSGAIGAGGVPGEIQSISGTFLGFGDPNLPGTIPSGAIINSTQSDVSVGTSNGEILIRVRTEPQLAAVPEPASLLGLLTGLGGFAIVRGRRTVRLAVSIANGSTSVAKAGPG